MSKLKEFFRTFENELPRRTKCLEKYSISEMGSTLLDFFFILGREGEFMPWAKYARKGPRKSSQEYLVDVCWERKQDVTLSLAMEVEVSDRQSDGIMHDLEKLVHIKAPLKVGICWPIRSEQEKILERFGRLVSRYKLKIPGEQYLIILFDYEKLAVKKNNLKFLLKISGFSFEDSGKWNLVGQKSYLW